MTFFKYIPTILLISMGAGAIKANDTWVVGILGHGFIWAGVLWFSEATYNYRKAIELQNKPNEKEKE